MNIYSFSMVTFYSILWTGIVNISFLITSVRAPPHVGPAVTNCTKWSLPIAVFAEWKFMPSHGLSFMVCLSSSSFPSSRDSSVLELFSKKTQCVPVLASWHVQLRTQITQERYKLTVFERGITKPDIRQLLKCHQQHLFTWQASNSRLYFQNWPERKGLQVVF